MKEFKKPNVKAPRFRPEVHSFLNKEFFEKFKKKYPRYKELDNNFLKELVKKFNETIYQTVIDTRDGVQLPELIGWLYIGTCQQSKKVNVDFGKSHKYGVTVSNKNWETDGKLAKIFYSNYTPKHKMKNREIWSFVACRQFKRAVAKSYPENWNMYVIAENLIQANQRHKTNVYKEYMLKQTDKALEKYNEFDL